MALMRRIHTVLTYFIFLRIKFLLCVHCQGENLNNLIFHVLKIGTDDVKELKKICEKYNQPMPTQIKLIYDNKQNKVKGKYSYDLFYSNSDTLTSGNIFEQWYNEVKEEIEGNYGI